MPSPDSQTPDTSNQTTIHFQASSLVVHFPELSHETAARLLDLLQDLTGEFERYYGAQIRQYYDPNEPPLHNPWEQDPPF